MFSFKKQFFFISMMMAFLNAYAKPISVDLQSVATSDALHIIARAGNLNLILSPSVRGTVTLHLHDVTALQAVDFILHLQGLARAVRNNVIFVMPQEELMKQSEDERKLQDVLLEVTPLLMRVWQIQYAKAEEIGRMIGHDTETVSLLSKRGQVRIDARTNRICVRDTPLKLNEIDALIKRLDIPVQQVLIDVRLVSIDSDYERELGVSFVTQASPQATSSSAASIPSASLAGATRYTLAAAKLADGSLLDVQLAALENEGHGELLSSPSLFTANQQTASIESGEEIPYQEISRSGATGVAFKKAVLSLKVTPQVLPGGKVLLQLQVNQDKPSSRIVQGVPAITTRQVSTNVLLANGQTIVLGGIFESNKDTFWQRIPFLSKIPLVGLLFQQQNVLENKRELLIFVTPKIIKVV